MAHCIQPNHDTLVDGCIGPYNHIHHSHHPPLFASYYHKIDSIIFDITTTMSVLARMFVWNLEEGRVTEQMVVTIPATPGNLFPGLNVQNRLPSLLMVLWDLADSGHILSPKFQMLYSGTASISFARMFIPLLIVLPQPSLLIKSYICNFFECSDARQNSNWRTCSMATTRTNNPIHIHFTLLYVRVKN